MNNYNLTSIQEVNADCYLQTPFYWGPGLRIHTARAVFEKNLEDNLCKSAADILKAGVVELRWVEEKQNCRFLGRILAKDPDATFIPFGFNEQILNAHSRNQPFMFFVERKIYRNERGSLEIRLRFSCEVEPHEGGIKNGYGLSIVAGTSLYKIYVDKDLKVIGVTESKECILPHSAFTTLTQTNTGAL